MPPSSSVHIRQESGDITVPEVKSQPPTEVIADVLITLIAVTLLVVFISTSPIPILVLRTMESRHLSSDSFELWLLSSLRVLESILTRDPSISKKNTLDQELEKGSFPRMGYVSFFEYLNSTVLCGGCIFADWQNLAEHQSFSASSSTRGSLCLSRGSSSMA
jgi:hypothetical protein